jgi:hypothetical protein
LSAASAETPASERDVERAERAIVASLA